LTVNEARTLAAMCDQLIAADADPGADGAHVVNYLDIQLCGPYRNLRGDYRAGITAVEQTSQKRWNTSFGQLSNELQLAILTALEKGEGWHELWGKPSAHAFFEMVVSRKLGSKASKPRAINAAPTPHISLAARNMSTARRHGKQRNGQTRAEQHPAASFLKKNSLPPRKPSNLKKRFCSAGIFTGMCSRGKAATSLTNGARSGLSPKSPYFQDMYPA
jgi:Gluconate 2-dehydrogenase subunit 3